MTINFESARKDFAVTAFRAFLSSSAVAPLPRQTIEAMDEASRKLRGEFDSEYESGLGNVIGDCKKAASRLVGSRPEEISLVHSTTEGVCAFAESLDWRRRDEIVINDLEYPVNVIPWFAAAKRHGAKVKIVKNVEGEIRPEDVRKAVSGKTKVISVSHVEFSNGFKVDVRALSEIAQKHGAYLFVDAIQSIGAMKVDVRKMGIDSLSAGGYKWMCGPSGTGIFYVKKELAEKLVPVYVGMHSIDEKEKKDIWNSLVLGKTFVKDYMRLKRGTGRFNYAFFDPIAFLGLKISVEYLLKLGIVNIEKRIEGLVNYLEGLVSHTQIMTPKDRAGILSFKPANFTEKRMKAFEESCNKNKINITIRQGAIRAACHFFNNEEDLERLASVVREF